MENIQKSFNQKELLLRISEIAQKNIQIIILFILIKGYKFENKEQLKSFISRNKTSANELSSYSLEKIKETLEWMVANTDFKITIRSVGKYIDDLENLNNKKSQTPKAFGEGIEIKKQ